MKTKLDNLAHVKESAIVAVIRASSGDKLVEVAKALVEGGVNVLEVTFTVPKALSAIEMVADSVGDRAIVGAGTVLDSETARAAMLAGAEFIVSPGTNFDVIEMCQRYDKIVMPGGFTPTEIINAWQAGADVVKVFPSEFFGSNYLKSILAPLPQVRLIPTGGVNLETALGYLDAGAFALGVGGALASAKLIDANKFDEIRGRASTFASKIKEYRLSRAE